MGTRALRRGGNAVDAAVTTALALSVTRPQACGIGGGGLLLARDGQGEVHSLDFRETLPRRVDPDGETLVGARAAGVPGVVAGLAEAVARLGSRGWQEALAPATELAEDGVRLTTQLAGYFDMYRGAFLPSTNRAFPPLEPGALLRQPELARTLRILAGEGPRAFYEGAIAELIAREIAAGDGVLDAEDLAAYIPRWRVPLRQRWLGRDVFTPDLPSRGGRIVGAALARLEALPPPGTPERAALLGSVFREAFAATVDTAGDPDRCTTHIAALDGQGGAASLTFSLNTTFGAKLVVGGAGFLLNNCVDDARGGPNHFGLVGGAKNRIAPGLRPATSMAPTLVVGEDGLVALGSAGGPRIPTTIVQVLAGLFHDGLPLAAAVAAPRVHHQRHPDVLVVEDGFPELPGAKRSPGLGLAACAQRTGDRLVVALDGRYRID